MRICILIERNFVFESVNFQFSFFFVFIAGEINYFREDTQQQKMCFFSGRTTKLGYKFCYRLEMV